MSVIDILRLGPVMPVLVIDDLAHAVPLARALVAGGIRVLEVTLRTPVALDAVRAMCAAVPDAVVGVGTLTSPQDLADSKAAGAVFGVSPGLTASLLEAARQTGLPLLPGTMTPSDVMTARAAGLTACKLFPAAVAGGVGMLKALYGPFADMSFLPDRRHRCRQRAAVPGAAQRGLRGRFLAGAQGAGAGRRLAGHHGAGQGGVQAALAQRGPQALGLRAACARPAQASSWAGILMRSLPVPRLPTLYIPHGGGPCFFMDWNPPDTWDRMAAWLRGIDAGLGQRPRAVLLISGHWEEPVVSVNAQARPPLLFDYYGFPPHTYQLKYPAPGDPALAARVRELLQAGGVPTRAETERGLDHGVFVPFLLVYPQADVPIVQLSLHASLDAAAHLALGALARTAARRGRADRRQRHELSQHARPDGRRGSGARFAGLRQLAGRCLHG